MQVPVGKQLQTSRGLLTVRIEETMTLDFDLGSGSQYVDAGTIDGRMLIDFELNRSALMDKLDRVESPSLSDKLNMFLENWSLDKTDSGTVELVYGQLLFKGAEPLGVDSTLTLGGSFGVQSLRSTSPDDLKRKLRTEETYETTYEELSAEVSEFLEREGIATNPSFSAPVHIQAKANPAVKGTNFTLTVKNNERWPIQEVTVKVDMPQEVGREVELGHWVTADDDANRRDGYVEKDVAGVDDSSSSYDPEENVYTFEIDFLAGVHEEAGSEREIKFYVPARAQQDLKEVSGRARFTRNTPFSNLFPTAVFDAGGHRLDNRTVEINPTGHVDATFSTPTEEISVSSVQEVNKRFQVEGVLPEEAKNRVEEVLKDRGVEGTEARMTENRNMRDGKEVVRYEGGVKNGEILVGDTRIRVNVDVQGEIRTANRETTRGEDENLPAERRSVATEYGQTNINVRGTGSNQRVVDDYITDLRDELQVTLNSISEAM